MMTGYGAVDDIVVYTCHGVRRRGSVLVRAVAATVRCLMRDANN